MRRVRGRIRSSPSFRLLPDGLLSRQNAQLVLLLTVSNALTSTIAHGHLFSAFIFELFGDNTSVGLVDSVSGVTSLLVAVPVGYAVDTFSRPRLLRWCAVVGLVAAVLGGLSVVLGPYAVTGPLGERTHPGFGYMALLCASLVAWGLFWNASSSAALALFADSVPSGHCRRELYATKSTLQFLSLAAGPLLALFLNVLLGNDWKLEHMSYALLPGFLIMPVSCLLLTLFEEVGIPRTDDKREPLLATEHADIVASAPETGLDRMPCALRAASVPYLMLAAELIAAVGAGMTVKFFGLWFKNVYNFTPAGLSAMQATSPFAIAIAVQALQRTAKVCPLGPVPVVLAFWVAGVAMLLAMLRISDWRLLVVLHLLRTSLINAKEPISRAILADFIPSSQRGRWNSLHSLTGMTWTGSAAFGGMLCDRHGYGTTFAWTAAFYLVAACCWIPLIRLVPREPKKADEGSDLEQRKVA
uniref:Major facilitator superfamily (MFS) profile domain-containing protein n=1 Tax=Noctiluca scintillans TaxID=2966 RepID=A0A7S1F8Q0_NOCSC|mmetsp:Transcript_43478/g.114689  ORF Transcript_43478/g.114689 Transcript_43478/m.114689 type:complete len:471 (+) Transcript_43478:41-1453(+)